MLRVGQSNLRRVKSFFSSPKRSFRFWGPLSLQFSVCWGSFLGLKWPSCEVKHSLPFQLRLQMSAAVIQLPIHTLMAKNRGRLHLLLSIIVSQHTHSLCPQRYIYLTLRLLHYFLYSIFPGRTYYFSSLNHLKFE